jgi:hypothetical protein
MFVHKRLFIVNTLTELIEAISKYPLGDRWRVESFARTTISPLIIQRAQKDVSALDWSRYFWRTNMSLVECRDE